MKPTVKYIVILLSGLSLGLILGYLLFSEKEKIQPISSPEVSSKTETKIITKEVKDTVFIERKPKVIADTLEKLDTLLVSDTLETIYSDTLDAYPDQDEDSMEEAEKDISDADLVVFTDKLIEKFNLEIQKVKNEVRDTTDSELVFNLETDKFNTVITVEYWSSPLELTGYELSRNKLKLYGFNPDEPITLIHKEGDNILNLKLNNLNLALEKTERFKTLYF